ncbi:helix-turn-helix domain-containing protein [Caballeronia sp. LZ032]|uniref:helix-turn-helix domain-containing protein n=1 Tax=Caballeronia sp. LZ032 TaxID=3038565 RepID=UPI0028594432|nr:helix-turn-helix domain-containing protein [Caballeronia sp. LZ032]MDR5879401.1 helix-turn-helix domain-containing protein [Caballeronia sp. LZ032]
MHKQTGPLDLSSFSSIISNWPENTAGHQRARLLEAMKVRGGVTTLEAMRFLDIVDPRPRIVELRKEGYRIKTLWTRQPSECGRLHSVGLYALISAQHGESFSGQSNASLKCSGSQMTLAL